MRTILVFASGFLVGGLVLRWLIIFALRRELRPQSADEQYHPAARAVLRHLASSGTINATQVAHMLSTDRVVALRHLDRMLRERLLTRHSHRDAEFYTLR